MDEMKIRISTLFMKGIITKLIKRAIRKKYGYQIDIQLNALELEIVDGKAKLHTNVEVSMDNEDLMNIIESAVNGSD